jgi:peptidyl-prolyl cis-trans isomerase D
MRNTVQNVGLLVVVVALCAVFLLQFGGPQSRGCSADGGARFAARVHGETITLGEMKAAYILANGPRYGAQAAREMRLKELVLAGLIERDLLARNARDVGFEASSDDVMVRLAEDGVIYVSAPAGAPASMPAGPMPINLSDESGAFSAEVARRFIQNRLGRTVEEFAEAQVKETLAERMREVVTGAVAVGPSEVWDAFVREKDRATIKFVRYDAGFLKQRLTLTTADLDAYVQANAAAVDAEFEREKHRFTGLEKQVRARHVLIKLPDAADDKKKAELRAKAALVQKRALKGEDFAALARELSEDTGSARLGGDLGYNTRGKMVAPFDDAQFALKPGEISDVVETRFGYHVIKSEGVREGDVPPAEAKRELAEKLAMDARAAELAKSQAEAALKALKGGETLDALDGRLAAEKVAAGDLAGAPLLQESRPFGRGASPVPGQDNSELVKAALALDTEHALPEAPIKVGDGWVVFSVIAREKVTKEAFQGAEKERLTEALTRRKKAEVLEAYVRELREKAEREGHVRINPEAVRYSASEETASL